MSCPICGGETQKTHRPFCSKRCADIDLGKWLTGAYSVPSQDLEDIENALEEAGRAQAPEENPQQTRH
ncbi:DNA gyrase inhibitor YacG [Leisingera sp. HS039]|uniref:DNA gyrase inhibitor YacG n=1 Tax=unclassified Leisingera TaxID=2614906 RepID=UPI001070AD21|nr:MULTISPECIES: DNA gyrase inhibitor YacG [unclassified Leisingera]MBQ4824346.1 DNA gyrase inhibitor YacG [Leisingera sp. HS039]MCF6433393.1 DNA gyrase inhibitor YacG [Leisingera sp. MMG026]QBR34897.1 DNA gyrase inhibitor YacG [Leisingera sp. NJS201]